VDAAQQLLARVSALRFEDIDVAAIAAAKRFIADSFGVALVGHRGAFTQGLLQTLQTLGAGTDACVWGANPSQRFPAASAAMANAYLIHCQEFDCVHEAAVVHPMAVILSSLMAECERYPQLSGKDLLLGVVAAVDVAAVLGMASQRQLKFFRPAQCGGLGAVAALAKLHGFDVQNALGVMLGQLSGTMQAHREGAAALPMQIAFAARNAITTMDLCRFGLRGPQQAILGEFGYLPLFEEKFDLPAALHRLQQGFAITQVSHKPFPSGRATHGGLDALQQLMQTHSFAAHEVQSMTLYAPPLVRQLVDRPALAAQTPGYLKLCFPYCAASLLLTGQLHVADFEDLARAEHERFALAQKITVAPDANQDPNALSPVRLEVRMHSGQCLERTCTHTLGSPQQPLSDAQHRAKFMRNWQLYFGKTDTADVFLEKIESLETLPSAAQLLPISA
jgi:aconitate decarboxylase